MGAHEPFRTAAASSLWNNIFDHANRPAVVYFYPEYCSDHGVRPADRSALLLHQDPRYFYQGTGSGMSRAIHAMSYAIICKGDNGRSQFNYSGIGGNLIAGSLTNLYYPPSNRGPGLVFSSTLINAGGRLANALVLEFVLHKYTTNANK
jgi:hypothetical protein